jgi:hypothetical protein
MMGSPLFRHAQYDTDLRSRPMFVATHRALVVCTRELGQLSDGIARHVADLHDSGVVEEPTVRRSPGRCIVQLGPVALTLAWLRSTLDTVAEGELLIVVWQGAVAPGSPSHPEHARRSREAQSAAVLWEDVFSVSAENEETWRWRSAAGGADNYTSAALAARCVERLRDAYAECDTGE